ncbi:MAG: glycosyltransferase N-terminal domain-containing protein [Rubritalea sp.]|uniref:3-deoxy-D-manno-octulosonic acid transferase n=1 Tax=Rubritalea sp. TaxID=2109375 RepID=UPI003242666A
MEQRRGNGLFWIRVVYNILLPLVLLIGVGPWVVKMLKRGGFGSGLLERAGIYNRELDFEPSGVVYIHAVSVGEVLIALKLIAAWQGKFPEDKIVLAPTTATGHAVAMKQAPDSVRVVYSPVDLPFVVGRMLKRFEPKQIVLIESEVWPNLLAMANKRSIPITVGNARLSARSERRYLKLQSLVQPIFGLFSKVAVPEVADKKRWYNIGVPAESLEVTGSIKFDQAGASAPKHRDTFQSMLAELGGDRKVVMALSTHAGEEALIAEAMLGLGALCVVIPRHAERRDEVQADLQKLGYEVVLRSQFKPAEGAKNTCFVIDSTGEMRDWTALADVAIVGKSFLGEGGQNPTEAIAAGVPVITGPNMGNFEPLVSMLCEVKGIEKLAGASELRAAIVSSLGKLFKNPEQLVDAKQVLNLHQGATQRTIDFLRAH